MPARINYTKGEKVGECIFIKDIPSESSRKGLFECKCGNEFEAIINDVAQRQTRSCGCLRSGPRSHGLTSHKLYRTYHHMIDRCYRETDKKYKNYGGRGISVCDEWRNDFMTFFDYMIKLPYYNEPNRTIDRIENDGNYEPGNVRWATHEQQAANRRPRGRIKYAGIQERHGKFISNIKYTLHAHLGTFDTAEEAVEARNKFIIKNKLDGYPIQKVNDD